jgi:protein-L-isoaspartate(D-aspartate) O-methyltransferase
MGREDAMNRAMNFLIYAILLAILLLSIPLSPSAGSDEFKQAREKMVADQIVSRGIRDPKVIAALSKVPRHRFVPENSASQAYSDHPLPIGEGQTISQPYVVALMTEALSLGGGEKVLEIGTGSGYQAAVLAETVEEVYSIEIKKTLHERAGAVLRSIGYPGIKTRHTDGYFGWKEAAPFDAIMITAAVDHIPPPLLDQLKDGGRLILPLGNPFHYQHLTLVTKKGKDFEIRQITGVLFVPMTGHAEAAR